MLDKLTVVTTLTTNLQYKQSAIKKYINDQTILLWKDATREFIKEVVSVLYGHIDTGMSIASIIPLATEVNFQTLIQEAIAGNATHYTKGKEYYDWAGKTGQMKTPALGEELGQTAYEIEFGTPELPKFVFRFKVSVFQYYLHEFGYAVPHAGAWNTLELGKIAFQTFLTARHREYYDMAVIARILRGR